MSKRLCLLPLLDASLPADPRGKLCDVCDDTHLAMTRCSVCEQNLSPMVTKVHGRLTTTRGHRVVPLASGRLEELIARGGGVEVLTWLDRWLCFDAQGVLLRSWVLPGTGAGQPNDHVQGLTVSPTSGELFVTYCVLDDEEDPDGVRVQVFWWG